jgi:hypothetical protein
MDKYAGESPEFRRWREEALPSIVAETIEEIRRNPNRKTVRRFLNKAVGHALSNLIILLERQPY